MREILGGIVAVQLTVVTANRTFDLRPNGSWYSRSRAGTPCNAPASKKGLCPIHADPSRASAMGRRSGRRAGLQGMRTLFDKNVGYLSVGSNADNATIAIDGDPGPHVQNFVVSPGDHEIMVFRAATKVNYAGRVNVPPLATQTFRCPAKAQCPPLGRSSRY